MSCKSNTFKTLQKQTKNKTLKHLYTLEEKKKSNAETTHLQDGDDSTGAIQRHSAALHVGHKQVALVRDRLAEVFQVGEVLGWVQGLAGDEAVLRLPHPCHTHTTVCIMMKGYLDSRTPDTHTHTQRTVCIMVCSAPYKRKAWLHSMGPQGATHACRKALGLQRGPAVDNQIHQYHKVS